MALRTALLTALCMGLSFVDQASETYAFDDSHTQISFSWSHFGRPVPPASFTGFTGTVVIDQEDLAASKVDVTIDARTLRTGFVLLNPIMESGAFFDAAHYPEIQFRSTGVRPTDATRAEIDGELTMKGITRPVVLDVQLVEGGAAGEASHSEAAASTLQFRATTTLRRTAWKLGGQLPFTSDTVDITIQAQLLATKADG